jgi:hypothetical protein
LKSNPLQVTCKGFLFLQLIRQSSANFKGSGIDILEVSIVGTTHEITAPQIEREMTTQEDAEVGVEGQHTGVARLALDVHIVGMDIKRTAA